MSTKVFLMRLAQTCLRPVPHCYPSAAFCNARFTIWSVDNIHRCHRPDGGGRSSYSFDHIDTAVRGDALPRFQRGHAESSTQCSEPVAPTSMLTPSRGDFWASPKVTKRTGVLKPSGRNLSWWCRRQRFGSKGSQSLIRSGTETRSFRPPIERRPCSLSRPGEHVKAGGLVCLSPRSLRRATKE